MHRYIDARLAEKALKKLEQEDIAAYGDDCESVFDSTAAINALRDVPTANVAPVVRAHWIPKKEMIRSPEAKNYNCSACGKESFAYPNCPFCRAIMDEEAKQ